ncbi:Kinesin-like protein KIN-7K, chloroplastic [Ancistrocladus abbreviatus]
MGPNMRSQHPGLPQPHHSQPPFHSHVKAPGSLGPSFPHGQPPLPSQLLPQPLYQASKQREAALEAALAEKEFAEEECRKKVDEAKKSEASLENDLANMWVLVAKLKKRGELFLTQNLEDVTKSSF